MRQALLLALLALAPSCKPSRPPEPAQPAAPDTRLADEVRAALLARHPHATVVIRGPHALDVALDAGTPTLVALGPVEEACRVPAACPAAIDAFVAKLSARPGVARHTLEALRPQLIGRGTVAPPESVTLPAPGGLTLGFVFDDPRLTLWVQPTDLAPLHLDPQSLKARALANLDAATPPFHPRAVVPGKPLFFIHDGDTYDAARLLLEPRWAALAAGSDGFLLASVPSRDALIFTDSRDPQAAVALQALTDQLYASAPGPLSRTVFEWSREGWRPRPAPPGRR